jgi:hypothetical protein
MKNFNKTVLFGAALAASAGIAMLGAPVARAQVSSAPMVVKETPPKKVWLKAEVIHADGTSIMVQDEKNSLMVRTFSFTPELRDRMQKVLDAGGYQYGDKVRILYKQGDTVALDVRGRPSKAL